MRLRKPRQSTPTPLNLAKNSINARTKNNSNQNKKQQSLESLLALETDLRSRGYQYVIGCDDSGGAGCIAGPVVVASCCLLKPFSYFLSLPSSTASSTTSSSSSPPTTISPSISEIMSKVNDSKMLSADQRQEIYDVVTSHPDIFAISVASRSPKQIDEINLIRATQDAFAESIETLVEKYELPFEKLYAVVDGKVSPKVFSPYQTNETEGNTAETQQKSDLIQTQQEQPSKKFSVRPYVNGDANVYTVAIASIIAKVTHNALLRELHVKHPGYELDRNLGQGTRAHVEFIHQLGSVDGVHRMSFKQVKGR